MAAAAAAAAAGSEVPGPGAGQAPGEQGPPHEPPSPGLAVVQALRAVTDAVVTPAQWEAVGQMKQMLSDVRSAEGDARLELGPAEREWMEEAESHLQLLKQLQRYKDAMLDEAEVRGAALWRGLGAIGLVRAAPRGWAAAGEQVRPATLPRGLPCGARR